MRATTIVLAATSAFGVSAIQNPPNCINSGVVNYAGSILVTCPNQDYRGETKAEIANIKNVAACAKECSLLADCDRAVFDKQRKVCLIKAASASTTLTRNTKYASATLTNSEEDGAQIDECPTKDADLLTAPKSQEQYRSCLNADYEGNSVDVIGNVADIAACADVCAYRQDCINAVYVREFKACHIKDQNLNVPINFRRGFARITIFGRVPSA
ncbi:hypothetical protein NX059_003303 [Plenodomus lindquistii]|nr:hypothetical protein NX059_003303 [Plenodomus lindquistii]